MYFFYDSEVGINEKFAKLNSDFTKKSRLAATIATIALPLERFSFGL